MVISGRRSAAHTRARAVWAGLKTVVLLVKGIVRWPWNSQLLPTLRLGGGQPSEGVTTAGQWARGQATCGVGSSERSGGRGAGAGRRGQTRSSQRLCSSPGERPGEESPGEDRDCPPRHSGLGGGSSLPPPSPPSGIPHPPPSSRPWSQVSRPPSASSLYTPHPQNCTNPKTLKFGMGKEERWGRRCAMGRVPPERWMFALECWSFFFFFSLP